MRVGGDVLLFDPPNGRSGRSTWKRWHLRWLLVCLVVTLAAGVWYGVVATQQDTLPGGSSWPGLIAGGFAGLLFAYLFAFALRKLPIVRLWFARRPTKYWLAQHIWLGLLTFPLVTTHSALLTRWGGPLTTGLMVVYFAVLMSGIWGLWVQQTIPRRLLHEIPDEANFYQLPDMVEQFRREAELLVLATCGAPAEYPKEGLSLLVQSQEVLRAAREGRGSGLLRVIPANSLPDTEPLRQYFRNVIDPYLRGGTSPRGATRLQARMKAEFGDLRRMVNPAALPVVDALEAVCEHRREFDAQAQLHRWLHGWLVVHLCLSCLLILLVICHAVSAVWYW